MKAESVSETLAPPADGPRSTVEVWPQVLRIWRILQHSFALQVFVTLLIHHMLWPALRMAGAMSMEGFAQPILLFSALQHLPFFQLGAIGALAIGLTWRSNTWQSFDDGGATRLFVLVPVFVFAWQYSLYDYNLILDQGHVTDRLLLVALAVGVWFHPGFVFAFVLWLSLILGQLNFPLPESGWHWPDKRLPYDAMVLFSAYLVTRVFLRPHPQVIVFLIFCLTGATYSHAGIEKMLLGPSLWSWWLHNHVANVFVGAWTQASWLSFLSKETVAWAAALMDDMALFIGTTTLLIEVGALALMVHRRLTLCLIPAFMALHGVILLTTGIFFWKWIVFDGALLLWWLRLRGPRIDETDWQVLPGLNPRVALVASLLIMGATRFIFYNVDFAWFDTRLTNYFQIRGTGVSGRDYKIDPRFFAPHDIVLNQSRFYYLVDEPVISGTYATVRDFELMKKLQVASLDDLPAIRERYGKRQYRAPLADLFLKTIAWQVMKVNELGWRDHPLGVLRAPYHFQRQVTEDTWNMEEPIARVDVRFIESFYDGETIHELSNRSVMTIDIPGAQAPPAAREVAPR